MQSDGVGVRRSVLSFCNFHFSTAIGHSPVTGDASSFALARHLFSLTCNRQVVPGVLPKLVRIIHFHRTVYPSVRCLFWMAGVTLTGTGFSSSARREASDPRFLFVTFPPSDLLIQFNFERFGKADP